MSSPNENTPPTAATSSSLADRVTKPELSTTNTPGMNVAAQTFQPASGRSWADEVNSPVSANPDSAPSGGLDAVANPATTTTTEEKTPNIPQMDGAAAPFNGSQLHEPDYLVELKLADMQADPNNPLYSIKSFDELGLLVTYPILSIQLKLTDRLLGVKISRKASLAWAFENHQKYRKRLCLC
jgi:hypothetical protein